MTSSPSKNEFSAALQKEKIRVDERLETLLDEFSRGPSIIGQAVRYMVLDGGKRLRPVLCLWTHDAMGGAKDDAALDAGCAIECLHTYSLIHDDLPCMDDDDLRRGRPSCHKKFGEAVAVLAGDALLTLCFEILTSIPRRWGIEEGTALECARVVARSAGTGGLIGGQVLDVAGEGTKGGVDLVERIHSMKTAALIAASMESGAVMAGAGAEEREGVRRAGEWAGRAFQIIDDVLDVESDGATLGKTPGKDERDGKLTYPSVVGIAGSRVEAKTLIAKADEVFRDRASAELLRGLLAFMVERGR